jgi:hypothetical protein
MFGLHIQSREARALRSLALQPSQPLSGILNLSNTRISVFPEVEEFIVLLDGFYKQTFFELIASSSSSAMK